MNPHTFPSDEEQKNATELRRVRRIFLTSVVWRPADVPGHSSLRSCNQAAMSRAVARWIDTVRVPFSPLTRIGERVFRMIEEISIRLHAMKADEEGNVWASIIKRS
jgi:hypothetical protein